jgi:hypothetical protein
LRIKGLEGISPEELDRELENGARFVLFTYCISILILTFRRTSDIFYVRPGASAIGYGLPYLLISLLFGWWGIPWGPIYTLQAIGRTLNGGKDVTNEIVPTLGLRSLRS